MNDTTVISYILTRWMLWLIIFFILSALFAMYSFIKRVKKYRWLLVLPLLLYTIYAAIPTINGFIDISQDSYITQSVSYYRPSEANTRGSLTASESIQVTLSTGETLTLKCGDTNFPYGRYTGVIVYAQRSKIAISFTPD